MRPSLDKMQKELDNARKELKKLQGRNDINPLRITFLDAYIKYWEKQPGLK